MAQKSAVLSSKKNPSPESVTNTKPTILIVEDDLDVSEMLNAYFRVQGYDCLPANWGEDALRIAESTPPDLAILDIRLPDIDGYEVARRLRASRHTRDIPIIFLTEKRERQDKLEGLALGAEDYITKPFDIQELRLRVRNALSRTSQNSLTHPVTGLPDGPLVDEHLQGLLGATDWAVLVVSIVNLDRFREAYGFVAADDVLRAMSVMTYNALHEGANTPEFLGHLTTTDLCIVANSSRLQEIHSRLSPRLQQSLEYFYPLKDRDSGKSASAREALRILIGVLNAADVGSHKNLDALKTALLHAGKA